MLKITGTFLNVITHDIPSLNPDEPGWDREFALMKSVGIERAVMIRCGRKKWAAYPSRVLAEQENAFLPPITWEKLHIKLEAAQKAGITEAITFDFAHFLRPNSCCSQAVNLLKHYCSRAGIPLPVSNPRGPT